MDAFVHQLKRSRWYLQTSVSVPEQTFALFKVLHHSGDGKKFKNILHVYILCTLVPLFSFLVRLFNHSLLIFKLLLDWKLVSFGPFFSWCYFWVWVSIAHFHHESKKLCMGDWENLSKSSACHYKHLTFELSGFRF